MNLQKRLDA